MNKKIIFMSFVAAATLVGAVFYSRQTTSAQAVDIGTIAIEDMTLPGEGTYKGVPLDWSWNGKGSISSQSSIPDGYGAIGGWGQIYEADPGSGATNTRIMIRDMQTWLLMKNNTWQRVEYSPNNVEGSAFVVDFAGNATRAPDIRMQDGYQTVLPGGGYNYHFWHSGGGYNMPNPSDVAGVFSVYWAKLVLADPAGPDDRAQANFLAASATDLYPSAQNHGTPPHPNHGIGRPKKVTTEWRAFTGNSIVPHNSDIFRTNPPPVPIPDGAVGGVGGTVVNPPLPPGAGTEPVVVDPDLQYVGQSCVISDGRGGTCEYVTAPNNNSLNCQDKKGPTYRSVAGVCPGSANMQCCVAPPTAILGQAGYLAFAKYAIDCTNGVSVTAAYQAGDDPTKPPIYYNIELVDGPEQAGIGRGTLIAQDVSINQGTFETMNPAWFANGRTIQFYIYTIAENTNPPIDYTIHGLDAIGALLARRPDETPPAPFTLTCPATPQPPEPPPIVPPVDVGDGGTERDVAMTLRLFMPLSPPGTINQTPALTTIQTAVTVNNLAINGDNGSQIVDMKYLNNGVWEGTYVGRHIPGSGFSISVKPLNHAKKTFCHSGTGSAQATYANYECDLNEGTVTVSAGRSILDFSKIPLGAGDLVVDGRSDSVIDSQDLLAILFAIARRSPYSVRYDANLDGTISQEDFELALWSMLNVSH